MAEKVVMPQMGESVAEGTVVRWLKKPGDRVERDEPLLEISTDKVDAEIPSPASGILTKILVRENQTVEVNTVIAEIESGNGRESRTMPDSSAAPVPPLPAVQTTMPPSPLQKSPAGEKKIRSSPLVRKMAQEHGIDLSLVPGTGLGGRVSKQDILAYLAREKASVGLGTPAPSAMRGTGAVRTSETAQPAPLAEPPAEPVPPPAMTFSGPTQIVPMTPMRRQIAEHMVLSKRTSPHVATVFEVEMTKLAQLIAGHGDEFERRNGFRLTYTPFIIRAAVEALKRYPIVNSSVDGGNIVYKRNVNIGVAVALETGLIVPVIKNADEKSFLGVARALSDLAARARTKRLSVDDVLEGTFTISNHGITGSLIGTPIISQPQTAILGVGKIEKRPVVRDDAIAIRTMVYLTLSFDHRVLDGASADQFMTSIKSALENWIEPVL
ncbi:MAG: 2-oxo acid dehydrogenase subunit E2 [Acidobacteriota bacterium]|nr:2-oxo acid dehydrogenase subunit E2 [Acidobacteriota bacterium]